MFAFVAFPYNAPSTTPIQLIADDGFGNSALLDVDFHMKPQFWRTRPINISDKFIRKTVPSILAQTPELTSQNDLLEDFLQVNGTLRIMNNQTIADLTKQSRPGAVMERSIPSTFRAPRFRPPSPIIVSICITGKLWIPQDHLGFDLAVTKHYPVEAANHGIVLFAGYLGIYGQYGYSGSWLRTPVTLCPFVFD